MCALIPLLGNKVCFQKLVRHLTFSESRKVPIQEFDLDRLLKDSELNMDEFIDLCILLGCDYCDTIKGLSMSRSDI